MKEKAMPIFKGNTRLSGKEINMNLFLPDYAKGVVITAPYTCPSRGLVWCWQVASNRDTWLLINNIEVARMYDLGDSGSCGGNGYAWVTTGDVVSYRGTPPAILRFYPMKA